MKKVICALGLAIASVGSALATTYPLTIENCGYKETFTKAPERVVALGQNIDNELGLPVERNEVVAEGSNVEGKVFVAGDIAKGDKTVVAAVNKGKLAAYEIHNRIGG